MRYIHDHTLTYLTAAALVLAVVGPLRGQPAQDASKGEVYQWLRLARDAASAGDHHKKARQLIADARAWAGKHKEDREDRIVAAHTEQVAGEVEYHAGDRAKATAAFTAALSVFTELKDQSNAAICHHFLGNLAFEDGKPKEATEAYQKALELYQAEGGNQTAGALRIRGGLAICCGAAGMQLHKQGKHEAAREQYASALKQLAGLTNQDATEACIRLNLGALLMGMGQSEATAALEELKEALRLYTKVQDNAGQARSLYNIAMVYEGQGRSKEAIDTRAKALAIQNGSSSPINQPPVTPPPTKVPTPNIEGTVWKLDGTDQTVEFLQGRRVRYNNSKVEGTWDQDGKSITFSRGSYRYAVIVDRDRMNGTRLGLQGTDEGKTSSASLEQVPPALPK